MKERIMAQYDFTSDQADSIIKGYTSLVVFQGFEGKVDDVIKVILEFNEYKGK